MKIITIAGAKGGISKSILSVCLAQCLAQNYKVCIYDSDLQGSINSFKNTVGVDVVDSIDEAGHDICIVDTAPYLSDKLAELIDRSDYVIMPVRPNAIDAVALKGIVSLVGHKPAGIVLTQVQHRVNINDVVEVLKGYKIPLLKQSMSQRVSYSRAIMQNLFETDDVKAQNEILQIVLEIFASIK